MSPDHWRKAGLIYRSAMEREESARDAYLHEACRGDEELRRCVRDLLGHTKDEAGNRPLQLGPYQIVGVIGAGGMGTVYQAMDTRLGRTVAIKIASDRFSDRFQREARAVAALNHPHICTLYDVGPNYLVMEYLEGRPLDGAMPVAQALRLAIQIADALAEAHRKGIVHRDLKPGNVLVTKSGAKVLDFGLARMEESAAGDDQETRTLPPHTEEGTIVGTTPYMSPEQAEGKPVDGRSDIFSFGAVLYEMVTGRRAFRGDSKVAVLSAILKDEPEPASSVRSEVPHELERIIARCLRKDRERRYQHMEDLRVALEEVKEESDSSVAAVPAASSSRRRRVWAGLIALAAIAGLALWLARRLRPPEEPPRAVTLTTVPGVKVSPSFSPEANQVTFAWNGPRQDNFDIYVQQIGAGSPLRLTTDARNDYNPAWSPDGRWIAFLRSKAAAGSSHGVTATQTEGSELLLVPPLGGPERKIADVRFGGTYWKQTFLSWCPNSACIMVTDSPGPGQPDALFIDSNEGGERRQLTHPAPSMYADVSPAVSPDGRWLAFKRITDSPAYEIYLLPLREDVTAAGEPRRLGLASVDAEQKWNAGHLAWTPDSEEIVFSSGAGLWRAPVIGDRAPTRLPFVGENGMMPVISRAQSGRGSRLAYVRAIESVNIWRVQVPAAGAPARSAPVAAISSTRMDANSQVSPDGRRVAFNSSRSGPMEIWVADPDGSNAVQLTTMAARLTAMASWSPDGQWIAFHSDVAGRYEIYVMPAAGGKPRRLTSETALAPTFSRDGKWIYFTSNRSGEYQIWKMPASGGEAVQVTGRKAVMAFESVDGAYLYYVETIGTPSALWRVPVSGGEPVKVAEGVVEVAFAVVAKGVYYIDQPSGETRLQFYDAATGKSSTVARDLGEVGQGLTAAPDGRTIFYTRFAAPVNDLMLVERFR